MKTLTNSIIQTQSWNIHLWLEVRYLVCSNTVALNTQSKSVRVLVLDRMYGREHGLRFDRTSHPEVHLTTYKPITMNTRMLSKLLSTIQIVMRRRFILQARPIVADREDTPTVHWTVAVWRHGKSFMRWVPSIREARPPKTGRQSPINTWSRPIATPPLDYGPPYQKSKTIPR
jgi:hypothetical protein